MKIDAYPAGTWIHIRYDYDGGVHVSEDWLLRNDAMDLYFALHKIFQLQPPLEPSETNNDE